MATAATGPLWRHAQAQGKSKGNALPVPAQSGLDHVVLVMMENRSFDHFLGWLPGANGRQAGLRYPDSTGQLQPAHHLTDFQGCAFQEPDHSVYSPIAPSAVVRSAPCTTRPTFERTHLIFGIV